MTGSTTAMVRFAEAVSVSGLPILFLHVETAPGNSVDLRSNCVERVGFVDNTSQGNNGADRGGIRLQVSQMTHIGACR